MTAKELHELPESESAVPYEGGFTSKDEFGNDAVQYTVGGDETGVHLHQHVAAGVGGGLASMYSRLSVFEAYEYAGSIVAAAQAADNLERENR